MRFVDVSELVATGGAPSNSWGSGYSEIYKLLQKLDSLEESGWYLNKKRQDATFKLETKITEYVAKGRLSRNVLTPKKRSEIQAVAELAELMKPQVETAKVCQLLDRMATDAMLLIRNTANGLIQLLIRRSIGLSFTATGNTNAQMSKTNLALNPPLFWASDKLAVGLLVHEYHHHLTGRNGPLYPDEFVAHWKQYLAMGLPRDRFLRINPFLLDDPAGYKLRRQVTVEFTRPEDAGTVWTRFPNN
jgi:hypothetical protein